MLMRILYVCTVVLYTTRKFYLITHFIDIDCTKYAIKKKPYFFIY